MKIANFDNIVKMNICDFINLMKGMKVIKILNQEILKFHSENLIK